MRKSQVRKRSIVIGERKTSISLETPFWDSLREIATARGVTVSALVSAIEGRRTQSNLSSAIRLFVLDHHRGKLDTKQDQT
jgi:predicted DNA-binding ribbon-helix-helix protein